MSEISKQGLCGNFGHTEKMSFKHQSLLHTTASHLSHQCVKGPLFGLSSIRKPLQLCKQETLLEKLVRSLRSPSHPVILTMNRAIVC
jgi:hypothetical protein